MKQIQKMLQGYKTYIIGCLTIALGIYTQNEEMIMMGLGFITLKAGLERKK